MNKAHIAGTLALVLLIALASLAGRATIPLSPANDTTLFERTPSFTWLGSPSAIEIDDNPSFTSPLGADVAGLNSYAPAEPLPLGTYYWRLDGGVVRTFELAGKASLEVENTDRGTLLKNTGNVDLTVGLGSITGAVIVPRETNRLLPQQYPDAVEGRADE